MKKMHKPTLFLTISYFGLYLLIGLSLLARQSFGSPPDEENRYLIPQYIAQNGTLPNGYDESILIPGYGFSYGFQPILPYMLQGYAMRIARLFNCPESALLYTARSVNLLLGLLMAWVVLLLSRKWFRDRRFAWLFSFLVTFLPQSIFIHTYVNTDSCCMLSITLMLYGLTLGLEEGFSRKASLVMTLGIILCALSYYNAYGYILSCILLFTVSFLSVSSSGKTSFDYRNFLKKGCFISALVLLGIAWWFIRSAILYDGDFLGLRTRDTCAALNAIPQFHPDKRITWASQGYSFWDMLRSSDFMNLSVLSFISMYGPMTISTSIWVYRFYKAFFLFGTLLCVILPLSVLRKKEYLWKGRSRSFRIFYHGNMIFCMIMPLLLSIYYSYRMDYQPQGRYLLPALIPLCYYSVRGMEKLGSLRVLSPLTQKKGIMTAACGLLSAIIVGSLFLTVYGYAFHHPEI